jgi:hypothetical protein
VETIRDYGLVLPVLAFSSFESGRLRVEKKHFSDRRHSFSGDFEAMGGHKAP